MQIYWIKAQAPRRVLALLKHFPIHMPSPIGCFTSSTSRRISWRWVIFERSRDHSMFILTPTCLIFNQCLS